MLSVLALLLAGFLLVATLLAMVYWVLRTLVRLLLRAVFWTLKLILLSLRISCWIPKSLILLVLSFARGRAPRGPDEQVTHRADQKPHEDHSAEERRRGPVGLEPNTRERHTATTREPITAILSDLRGKNWPSEAAVDIGLIRPLLAALGWELDSSNTEVWIPLTDDMARLWSYRSKHMRRDYVLSPETGQVLHVEVKHSWGTPSSDVEALLAQINRSDWDDTRSDGWKKDLALLLWGARSQNGRRAALVDEKRLLVFDWDNGWKLIAAVNLFTDSPDRVCEGLRLLERMAIGRMPV